MRIYQQRSLLTKELHSLPQLSRRLRNFLGITLKCATTKHPQTIGKLERTHASLKKNFKMACEEYRRQWHKYLPLAVINHNTSYHASIGSSWKNSI